MSELEKKENPYLVSSDTIDGEIATLNLGPTHPATHGVFQNVLQIDGEKILEDKIENKLKEIDKMFAVGTD